jgi:CO dehydrogenase/acetyl-CoA synthase alpha subunit
MAPNANSARALYDARTGDKVYIGPAPEYLFQAAETKEEAMVLIVNSASDPMTRRKAGQ